MAWELDMRRNPLIVLLALSALLLSTTGSALADGHDEYIAEAHGIGYGISIMGEEAFFGGVSEVEITSDPFAEAFGMGSSLDEGSESEATAENDGDHETDEGEGSLSAIPLVGDAIQVRSSAEAGITDGLPFASAEADGLRLELSGEILAEVLTEVFLGLEPLTEPLDEGIQEAFGEIEEEVLSEVRAGLLDACVAFLQGLEETDPLFDPLMEGLGELADELGALGLDDVDEDFRELMEELLDEDHACVLLADAVLTPPSINDVQAALIAALEGLDLLTVELASSGSDADAVPAEVVAFAEAVGLDVSLASLATLVDALEPLLDLLVEDFRERVIVRYGGALLDLAADIVHEDLMEHLGGVFDLLGLLDDDTPILQITAGDTDAFASFDRETGAITTEGNAVPLRVSIAESIAGLLGQEATIIEVDEGEEVIIFEDTPLESRLAGGTVTSGSAERDGLEGEEVLSEAFALSLIDADGEGPVLDITSAESYAAVFGGIEAEPAALPVTGGSAVPIALLLLAAGLLFTRRVTAPVVGREKS